MKKLASGKKLEVELSQAKESFDILLQKIKNKVDNQIEKVKGEDTEKPLLTWDTSLEIKLLKGFKLIRKTMKLEIQKNEWTKNSDTTDVSVPSKKVVAELYQKLSSFWPSNWVTYEDFENVLRTAKSRQKQRKQDKINSKKEQSSQTYKKDIQMDEVQETQETQETQYSEAQETLNNETQESEKETQEETLSQNLET